jgi:hypothetical protein
LRIAWLAVAAIAALVHPAAAGDPSDVVVAGPLPADEGLTLSGRVVGGTGTVEVRLQRREYQAGMWFPRTDGVTVAVPAGGRFRFDGLAPGRYECDFADQSLRVERDERTVDLIRDVTGHDLVVPSNCRVRGRVKRATSHADARVCVGLGVGEVTAAADGSFETPDVLPGEYRLRVRESWPDDDDPSGSASIERSYPVHLAEGVTERDVVLTPDEDVRVAVGVAGTVERGESPEGRCSARSAVVDTEPFWFRADSESGSWSVRRTHASIFGDEWGPRADSFRFDGLPRGRHVLRLEACGFEPWEREIAVDGPTRVEARLVPWPGRFLRATGRQWFERTEFRRPGGTWSEVLVGDRGRIVIDGPYEPPDGTFLAAGAWESRFESRQGVPTAPVALQIAADRSTLSWQPAFVVGSVLNGHLTTVSGRPLGGVAVHVALRERDGWRALPTKTATTGSEDGRFQVLGLCRARWRLALDEAGTVVLGEIDVGDADVAHDFTFAPR